MSKIELSKTPAGRQLRWLLNQVANGRPASEDELRDHFTEQMLTSLSAEYSPTIIMLHDQVGSPAISRLDSKSPHEIAAALPIKQGGHFRIDVTVEAEEPHRIAFADVQPISPLPAGQDPLPWEEYRGGLDLSKGHSGTLDEKLSSEINGILETAFAEVHYIGLGTAVLKDGEVVYFKSMGYFDLSNKMAPALDTTYRVGSISKTFTAIGVMQLVESGQIGLDDAANDHLKAYSIKSSQEVTVRQLLTHTGGVLPHPVPGAVPAGQRVPTLAEYFSDGLEARDPGKAFAYSNESFATLGQIIEDVTGTRFHASMIESVFDPLGMKNTDYLKSSRVGPVVGYSLDFGEILPAGSLDFIILGAGSVFSTANDMVLYVEALNSGGGNRFGRVLRAETLEEMYRMQFDLPMPQGYMGLAFIGLDIEGRRVFWHNGGINPGANAEMACSPETGWGLLMFSNVFSAAHSSALDQLCFKVMGTLLQ